MRRILIIGATSAIAEATARLFAADGDSLFLVGRDAERLDIIAADLRLRGAVRVGTALLDVLDYARHAPVIASAVQRLGGLDVVLIAHGLLPEQAVGERDFAVTRHTVEVNFLSVVSLLNELATYCERQRHGVLAVIGSVAGDRGRRANYIYGAAKGALAIFLQGLRQRLHPAGVRVLTLKPGPVNTPMTAGMAKGLLWAQPDTVAQGIYRAIRRGHDVVYLPGFWLIIMSVLRALPESLFKRLRF